MPPTELAAHSMKDEKRQRTRRSGPLSREREEAGLNFITNPLRTQTLTIRPKAQHWTLDEAVALAFGKAPEVVSWSSVSPFFISASPFALKYSRLRDLALRAKQWEKLFDPVLPELSLCDGRRRTTLSSLLSS